jgi:tRNA threonylcarbamoyladenosine biosynthesis protein TsaE
METFTVASPIGMWDVARAALLRVTAAQRSGAAVLALSGELGAGKTAFTQALAGVLGASGPVQSPTYVIMKKHQLSGGSAWHTLAHIDAYRLKGAEDVAAIGWADLIGDPGNLIVVEWPERIEGALPESALRLKFEHVSPTVRAVAIG